MKTRIILLFVLLGFLNGCNQPAPADDGEKLKQLLRDYFDGIKNRDLGKMNEVTTSDFVLFEDGKVWNNDSLINALSKFKTFSAEMSFTNFDVTVDNASGSMRYFNHCDCAYDSTKVVYDWIESATFKKADGKWKMNFLHSSIRK